MIACCEGTARYGVDNCIGVCLILERQVAMERLSIVTIKTLELEVQFLNDWSAIFQVHHHRELLLSTNDAE